MPHSPLCKRCDSAVQVVDIIEIVIGIAAGINRPLLQQRGVQDSIPIAISIAMGTLFH